MSEDPTMLSLTPQAITPSGLSDTSALLFNNSDTCAMIVYGRKEFATVAYITPASTYLVVNGKDLPASDDNPHQKQFYQQVALYIARGFKIVSSQSVHNNVRSEYVIIMTKTPVTF